MKGNSDHNNRKKKVQHLHGHQPVGPAQPAPAGQTEGQPAMLSLVNTTISKFQSLPLSVGKDTSLDRLESNNDNNSFPEEDIDQKVKILRGLSSEDILKSVNTALAKGHVPSKIKNVWEYCCNEVEQEIIELNKILEKLELPPSNYSKEKSFAWDIYEDQPDLIYCHTKDFLDFYVFPFLLPAVHSLLDFAKENRVFQCRYITFNSIDYLIEHLYNKNPLHPERWENPKTIDEIAYYNNWHSKFARSPLPKWLTMSEDAAAIKIQTNFRGFMVRLRPDVREMRQFWKDYKMDMAAEEGRKPSSGRSSTPIDLDSLDDASFIQDEEGGESHRLGPHETHSEECLICSRYREFFVQQEALEAERVARIKEEEERLQMEMEAEEAEYLELVNISPTLHAPPSTTSTLASAKTQPPQHGFKSTIERKHSSNNKI